jgi:hypothetical protein
MITVSSSSADREGCPPFAVLLGTNEIASAIAVHMERAGWRVVLSHDPCPPVIRRGMAFHDALFGEPARVEGVEATLAETAMSIWAGLSKAGGVMVTPLDLMDILPVAPMDALIDARMQKHRTTPDLRSLAGTTVGVGPKFVTGVNCDIAIETHPARTGDIVEIGSTADADGVPRVLGGAGRERFVYSKRPGRWQCASSLGETVSEGELLGRLDGVPVHAPITGLIRGMPRDGTLIASEVKVVEIDPRGSAACWTGIDQRGLAIAEGVLGALDMERRRRSMPKPAAALELVSSEPEGEPDGEGRFL